MASPTSPKVEGWDSIANSRNQHFFVGGFSLCGRWMTLSMEDAAPEPLDEPPPCKACHRLWLKRKAK